MKTINLTEAAIAEQMGRRELTSYMYDVVESGHRPGVLSGGKLQGKARQYSANYAKTRNRVIAAVAETTEGRVTLGSALINSRWARVWVDAATNEPVALDVRRQNEPAN